MDTLQYVYSSTESSEDEVETARAPEDSLPPPSGSAKRLSDIAYGGRKKSKSPSLDRKVYDKKSSSDNGRERSPDSRKDKHSPSYHSRSSSSREHRRSRDRDYDRDRDRGRDRRHGERSKTRRRDSDSHKYRYCRRSSSRSSRRFHRESPKRKSRDFSRSRSRSRSRSPPPRKHFDPKNKLYILNKMGIDYKGTESVDAPNKTAGLSGANPPATNPGVPPYYNPQTINAGKYAEQIAKRKLLWNNKKTEQPETSGGSNIWQGAKFSQDNDGKLAAKFQRLMGIKDGAPTAAATKGQELIKKQEELFSTMEMQYEVARATTHTQRGVGLGFGPRHIP